MAPLHDIGNIGIPDAILLRPGELSNDEIELMKGHTVIRGKILSGGRSRHLRMVEAIAHPTSAGMEPATPTGSRARRSHCKRG